MPNTICNNIAYLNSLDQKQRFQILNSPPVRYDNLKTNPYVSVNPTTGANLTKYDLDMRRKAEILKYNSNRMSTQTNSLTKSQRFSQAVNGSYQRRTYSQMYIDQNSKNGTILNVCPIVKTSSTASDVPGPPIMLYEDPAVPLYNLVNDANDPTYGIINQNINTDIMTWNNTKPVSVPLTTGNAIITSIYVLNTQLPTYNFTITTPVSVSITGQLQTGIKSPYSEIAGLKITINKVIVTVNYSYSSVPLNPLTSFSLFSAPRSLTFDFNMNSTKSTYTANAYLGLLTISNLILPVQKGFIYDIST